MRGVAVTGRGDGAADAVLVSVLTVLVKVVTATALLRMLAVQVGPAMLGLFAQLSATAALLTAVSVGLFTFGLTGRLATLLDHDPPRARRAVAGVMRLGVSASLVVTGLTAVAARGLSAIITGDGSHAPAIRIIAAGLPAVAIISVALATLAGRREVRSILVLTILWSGLQVVGAAVFAPRFGALGLFGALSLAAWGVALVVGLRGPVGSRWGDRLHGDDWIANADVRAIGSSLSIPLTASGVSLGGMLTIRRILAYHLSWPDLAPWQAVVQLSDLYLAPFTAFLSLYLLPRVGLERPPAEVRRVLRRTIGWMTGGFLVAGVVVLSSIPPIERLVFGGKVTIPPTLLMAQLGVDGLKLCAWPFAYLAVARHRMRRFVAMELLFGGVVISLTSALVARRGVFATVLAGALSYGLYAGAHLLLSRSEWRDDGVGA